MQTLNVYYRCGYIYTYNTYATHITRFKKMLRESEELVINRSSRLKDNIVHARIQTTTHIIIIKSSLITRDIHNTYYYMYIATVCIYCTVSIKSCGRARAR